MNNLSKELILAELSKIETGKGGNIVSSGIVTSVIIRGDNVGFVMNVGNNDSNEYLETIREKCENAIYKIDGVKKVTAVMTNEIDDGANIGLSSGKKAVHHHKGHEPANRNVEKDAKPVPKPPTPKPIPGVKKIIAVASGKGGVGKSTIASHLALALALTNKEVGLVDADIHGPSVAKMMGLAGEPEIKNNKMVPKERYGVKCMTMGLMMADNAPVVWRGPMITKALHQLMLSAEWGELDFLIMDLPPGTGDIQLSMAQNYKIDGVILVSTPQEVALLDVKKAATMFAKVNVPIIGLIENMSYFEDPETKNKMEIFGGGNAEKFCRDTGIRFLGKVPVHPSISASCDKGIGIENNILIAKLENVRKLLIS